MDAWSVSHSWRCLVRVYCTYCNLSYQDGIIYISEYIHGECMMLLSNVPLSVSGCLWVPQRRIHHFQQSSTSVLHVHTQIYPALTGHSSYRHSARQENYQKSEKNIPFAITLYISSVALLLFKHVVENIYFCSSSALEDHFKIILLMSSFHSVGLKTLDLKLFSLNESWASGIISLIQTCTSLQELRYEDLYKQMITDRT